MSASDIDVRCNTAPVVPRDTATLLFTLLKAASISLNVLACEPLES